MRTVAIGALLLTAVACLLPWASSSAVTQIGVQTGDGRVLGVVALAGLGLTLREISAAWMAPGFCVAIAVRAMSIINDNPDFEIRFGLWLAAFMAGLAAALLVTDHLTGIRTSAAHAGSPDS